MADSGVNIAAIVRDAGRGELARKMGCSTSHISRVLGGKRMPSSRKLAVLAEYMGVSIDLLYPYLAELYERNQRAGVESAGVSKPKHRAPARARNHRMRAMRPLSSPVHDSPSPGVQP